MTPVDAPGEQELVVHLYAPEESGGAEQLSRLWARLADVLGLDRTIAGTGLPLFPSAEDRAPGTVLAARTDGRGRQALFRRLGKALNISLLIPVGAGGWAAQLAEWESVRSDLDQVTTEARVFIGTAPGSATLPIGEVAAAVAHRLPLTWPRAPLDSAARQSGIVVVTRGPGIRVTRDLVVLAEDEELLSWWTWGLGDPGLPPLGVYLLQCSTVVHNLRVWQAFRGRLDALRASADTAATTLRHDPHDTAAATRVADVERALGFSEAKARDMAAAVRFALADLQGTPGPSPRGDVVDTERFLLALEEAVTTLANARRLARRSRPQANLEDFRPAAGGLGPRPSLGFVVDVVGYSDRPARLRELTQRRVDDLVTDVLADLVVPRDRVHLQGTGDGVLAFLPPDLDVRWTFRGLLNAWRDRLRGNNTLYTDRLRLRMSVTIGLVETGAMGFTDRSAIVLTRLIDSPALRAVVVANDEADLAVVISDVLHGLVVADDTPDLDRAAFVEQVVEVKAFRDRAWVWLGSGVTVPNG